MHVLDQRAHAGVGRGVEVCCLVLAGQLDVRGVRTVGRRQRAAGAVCIGGIAERGAAGRDVGQVENIVAVEAGHHAAEVDGMIELERAGGVGVEADVLAERAAEFERAIAVDQRRARAAHIAVDGEMAAVRPEQA